MVTPMITSQMWEFNCSFEIQKSKDLKNQAFLFGQMKQFIYGI